MLFWLQTVETGRHHSILLKINEASGENDFLNLDERGRMGPSDPTRYPGGAHFSEQGSETDPLDPGVD
jgi:hypothetical protein